MRIKLVGAQSQSPSLPPPITSQPSIPEGPAPSFSEKVMNAMSWVAPIKKLSDEEYLEVMQRQKDALEKRLGDVKSELGEEGTSTGHPKET